MAEALSTDMDVSNTRDFSLSAAESNPVVASGPLINLKTEGRASPLVSGVQRKKNEADEGFGNPLVEGAWSAPTTQSQNKTARGYVPGSYREKLKTGPGSGYIPGGSYTPGGASLQKPAPGLQSDVANSKHQTSDELINASVASASAASASVVSAGAGAASASAASAATATAEPPITLLDPFKMPGSSALVNPGASFSDPNFNAMEALVSKLSLNKPEQQVKAESIRVVPQLPSKEVLAQAGVDLDLDSLQSSDGRAPLELVAAFLTCVMNKHFEAALILCQRVLRFEPDNETAKEFYPTIIEKIHYGQNSESEDSSDEEDSSEEDDDEDDEDEEDDSDSSESSSEDGGSRSSSDLGDDDLADGQPQHAVAEQ
eukprot:m.19867 g.19867  ORF g.19867 m.19867 type:complete len:373 (+) comp27915_c1_seq4:329-1447(+)